MLPPADADREARLLVFTGRTGRWKGIFAVHSWVVFKPAGRHRLEPLRRGRLGQSGAQNGWAPDGRWYGDVPRVLVDMKGAAAEALIPKVQAAIKDYNYATHGDYRMWPARTATPSSPPCCAPCPSSRPRCRRTRSARTSAMVSTPG